MPGKESWSLSLGALELLCLLLPQDSSLGQLRAEKSLLLCWGLSYVLWWEFLVCAPGQPGALFSLQCLEAWGTDYGEENSPGTPASPCQVLPGDLCLASPVM